MFQIESHRHKVDGRRIPAPPGKASPGKADLPDGAAAVSVKISIGEPAAAADADATSPRGEGKPWWMEIEVKTGGGTMSFIVDELSPASLAAWRRLAAGGGSVHIIGGRVPVFLQSSLQTFFFCMECANGTQHTDFTYEVPLAAIAGELSAALDEAEKRGYAFAEDD